MFNESDLTMTRQEKKEELIGLFLHGAITIGDLIDECFEFGQQPSWISVEDELPKETNMYIVVHHNVVCTMTWYDNLKEWADIYVDENECVQSRQMDGVTHWMALPLPPAKLSNLERTGKNWKEYNDDND